MFYLVVKDMSKSIIHKTDQFAFNIILKIYKEKIRVMSDVISAIVKTVCHVLQVMFYMFLHYHRHVN